MKIKFFVTTQCSACHALEPKAKALASEFNIEFETINLIDSPEERGKHLLFSAPALLIFDETKEVKRFVRNFGLNEVEAFLKRVL